MGTLDTVRFEHAPTARTSIAIDEWVPLRLRTRAQPSGAAFLRLGDLAKSLLELFVDRDSRLVHGLTVTSIASFAPWPEMKGRASEMRGLPVLPSFDAPSSNHLDITRAFSVATSSSEVLVWWDHVGDVELVPLDERVTWLITQGTLVGVKLSGFTMNEIELLRSHTT